MSADRKAGRGFSAGALLLAAVTTGTVVYFLTRGAPARHAPASSQRSIAAPATEPPSEPTTLSAPAPAAATVNAIENARTATVFIRTDWGLGSGFIVDADCHVVTNRHVVETDSARVAATLIEIRMSRRTLPSPSSGCAMPSSPRSYIVTCLPANLATTSKSSSWMSAFTRCS